MIPSIRLAMKKVTNQDMADSIDQPHWIAGVKPSDELLAMSGTQVLEYECRQQPGKLRELIAAYSSNDQIRKQLRYACDVAGSTAAPVIFIGMGGSLCASIARPHICRQTEGWHLPSMRVSGCTTHTVYGKMPRLSVLVTSSGESAELVALMKQGTQARSPSSATTPPVSAGNWQTTACPSSPGPEYGNATKTYTNSTAAGIILAAEILGRAWQADADRAAAVMENSIDEIFSMRHSIEDSAVAQLISKSSAGAGHSVRHGWAHSLYVR